MEAATTGAAPASTPSTDDSALLSPPLPCDLVLADRYRLRALLASGATSHVYRADDLLSQALSGAETPVALKVYTGLHLQGRDIAGRLALDELRIARRLHHPHILRLHELGWDAPVCFLSMEYIAGESLAQRLRRSPEGRLEPALLLPVATALAAAVDVAHGCGIVHGDIKPANVLLGDRGEIKLIDFASARDSRAPRAESGFQSYSARYASPAVLAGAAAGREDDHYALACLIFELLTGDLPYGPVDVLEGLRAGRRPTRPSGMTRRAWHVLRRALALDGQASVDGASQWVRRVLR